MKVVWRDLITVLTEEEVLDKGFSRAKKSADRVDDPVKVFRVRKPVSYTHLTLPTKRIE